VFSQPFRHATALPIEGPHDHPQPHPHPLPSEWEMADTRIRMRMVVVVVGVGGISQPTRRLLSNAKHRQWWITCSPSCRFSGLNWPASPSPHRFHPPSSTSVVYNCKILHLTGLKSFGLFWFGPVVGKPQLLTQSCWPSSSCCQEKPHAKPKNYLRKFCVDNSHIF